MASRPELRYSQEQLATFLQVSIGWVNKYINMEKMPRLLQPMAVHIGILARIKVNGIYGMPTKTFFERVMMVMDEQQIRLTPRQIQLKELREELSARETMERFIDKKNNAQFFLQTKSLKQRVASLEKHAEHEDHVPAQPGQIAA